MAKIKKVSHEKFQCNVCGDQFNSHQSAMGHFESMHEDRRVCPSQDCGHTFRRRHCLRVHLKSFHFNLWKKIQEARLRGRRGRGEKASPRGKVHGAAKARGRPERKAVTAAFTPSTKCYRPQRSTNKRIKYREISDSEEEVVDSEEEPQVSVSGSSGNRGKKQKAPQQKCSSKKSEGEREFVCNLCGRSYGMYSTLCAHKNRSHKPSGKPCEHCTCIFSSKEDLALHCKKYHRHVRFAPELSHLAQRGSGRPKRNVASIARFSCQYEKFGTECRNQNALTSHIKGAHAAPVEVVTLDLDLDESAFKCDQCSVGFDTKQELVAHRSSAHDYDVIKMPVENPNVDANGKYLCHFCSTVFSRFTAMVAHVKAYHADENRLLCFECSEEFSSLKELELRKEKMHGGEEPSNIEQTEVIPVITSCTSLSNYEKPKQPKCELCGRVFLRSRNLWTHRKRSHVTDGRFGCQHCSCGFATARGLENHQLIYHGIRAEKKQKHDSLMIDCDKCPETFTSNRAYIAHKKRAHYEGENGAPCPDCYCIFKSTSALKIHRIKIHGYEIPSEEPEVETGVVSQPVQNASNSRQQKVTSPVEEDVEQSFDDRYDEIFADSTYDDHEVTNETNEVEPLRNSVITPEIQEEWPPSSTTAATLSSPVRYSCDVCSTSLGCLSYVIAHKRMRHKIEETECTICKVVFPTTDLLLNHTTAAHDAARNEVKPVMNVAILPENEEDTRVIKVEKVPFYLDGNPNTFEQNYDWDSIFQAVKTYTSPMGQGSEEVPGLFSLAPNYSPAGGPPPPSPPPAFELDMSNLGISDDRAHMFAELNRREDVAKGLKKNTADMQKHKNPNLRVGGGVAAGAQSAAGSAAKKPAAPVAKSPKLALEGKKWVLEHQVGQKELKIENVEMNHVVYAFACKDSVIQIKGKINSITLDSCKRTSLVFDSLVESVEFVNCRDCQMQVMRSVPTILVDQVDGLQMFLSKDSLGAEIFSFNSLALHVNVAQSDGKFVKEQIPEYFRTTMGPKGLETHGI